jgi:hypothetical protein
LLLEQLADLGAGEGRVLPDRTRATITGTSEIDQGYLRVVKMRTPLLVSIYEVPGKPSD